MGARCCFERMSCFQKAPSPAYTKEGYEENGLLHKLPCRHCKPPLDWMCSCRLSAGLIVSPVLCRGATARQRVHVGYNRIKPPTAPSPEDYLDSFQGWLSSGSRWVAKCVPFWCRIQWCRPRKGNTHFLWTLTQWPKLHLPPTGFQWYSGSCNLLGKVSFLLRLRTPLPLLPGSFSLPLTRRHKVK